MEAITKESLFNFSIELRLAKMMQKTYNHPRIQVSVGMNSIKVKCDFLFKFISLCVYNSINLQKEYSP